ncbi:hypothetical protein BDB00DRAFT_847002 [Zychaea mexicana]|uniref:uncharacterized protein n=1 Tax=Zychaea mexicana TaxID=64656 RepID=UPI0022FECD45|nr:uncharacterized protein BDB00DRAFT_847002 [Zychaea mexicana]KAI9488687.1 hypothetical protein BDB00DRAFT_847002 [Zychaea mexicana]
MIQQAELKRKRDAVAIYFKTTKPELFLFISDEGVTLRNIEQANDVHISIMVDEGQYVVEGLPQNVAKAQQEIKKNLKLIQEDVSLSSQLKQGVTFEDVVARVMPIIPNVSKQSGTYISTSNDKFTFTSLSYQSMDQAKLLMAQALSELDITKKSSLGAADYTFANVTQLHQQLEFVPVHDSQAMSLTSKPFGWSRVRALPDKNNPHISSPGQLSFYNILGNWSSNQNAASGTDIKALLKQHIGSEDSDSNVHLEARFGAVLYENLKSKTSPMLTAPQNTIFDAQALQKYTANTSRSRRIFFGMQPPSNITAPLLPVTSDHGIHRRSVVLEYVNRNDLVNLEMASLYTPPPPPPSSNNDANALHRVRVEFLVQEDGSLLLEKAEGERKRATIDLIALAG